MADDRLPIVFKGSAGSRLAVLALGVAISAGGIMMIFDQSGRLVGGLRPSTAGWIVSGIGLVIVVLLLVSLARGCPMLELTETGIVYSRCLQGVTSMAWSEFDRAEIQRVSVPRSTGDDMELEGLVVFAVDGRKIELVPIAPVGEMHGAIMRVAAGVRSAGKGV